MMKPQLIDTTKINTDYIDLSVKVKNSKKDIKNLQKFKDLAIGYYDDFGSTIISQEEIVKTNHERLLKGIGLTVTHKDKRLIFGVDYITESNEGKIKIKLLK